MSKWTMSGGGGEMLGCCCWVVLVPLIVVVDGVEEDGRTRPGAATMVGRGRSNGVGRMRSVELLLDGCGLLGDEGVTDASEGKRVDGRTMGVQSLLVVRRLLSNTVVETEGTTEETVRSVSCPSGEVRRILARKSVTAPASCLGTALDLDVAVEVAVGASVLVDETGNTVVVLDTGGRSVVVTHSVTDSVPSVGNRNNSSGSCARVATGQQPHPSSSTSSVTAHLGFIMATALLQHATNTITSSESIHIV